jgi:hypothetical protein
LATEEGPKRSIRPTVLPLTALKELGTKLDAVRKTNQAELHVREDIEAALREKLEAQTDQAFLR